MDPRNIYTHTIYKNIITEQKNLILDKKYDQITFLVSSNVSDAEELCQQQISNILFILSQNQLKNVIFDGPKQDLSFFMQKEIEEFLSESKNISRICIFAKENQQFKFLTLILKSIPDVTIRHNRFHLEKINNQLSIKIDCLSTIENYMSLLSDLSKNQQLEMKIVILNCIDVDSTKRIEIFKSLYSLFEAKQQFKIIMLDYIEYINKNKYIIINHQYWSDEIEEKILNELQISNLQVQFSLNSQDINVDEEILKIKKKYNQLNKIKIDCWNEQFTLNSLKNFNKQQIDIFISSKTSSIKLNQNYCEISQIRDNKLIVDILDYYLINATNQNKCQITVKSNYFNILNHKRIIQNIIQLNQINVKFGNIKIILNESEFYLELNAKSFNQLDYLLQAIYQQYKQQLSRLKILSSSFIQLSNENILHLKRKYNFSELKMQPYFELTQNSLFIEELLEYQAFDEVLNSFSNLQSLDVSFKSVQVYENIFQVLPPTLNYLKISYNKEISLILKDKNLTIKDVDSKYIDQLKKFIDCKTLEQIEIQIQCFCVKMEWLNFISDQNELSSFLIKLSIVNCFKKPICQRNPSKIIIDSQLKELLLSFAEQRRTIQLIQYKKKGILTLLEPQHLINNNFFNKLDFSQLHVLVSSTYDLTAIFTKIQSRKQLNLPSLSSLHIDIHSKIEICNFEEIITKMSDHVKQIFIYSQKQPALTIDFENNYYFSNRRSDLVFSIQLSDLSRFDDIQYQSNDFTFVQQMNTLLLPLNLNQNVYLNLSQTYEQAINMFKQLNDYKLPIFCDLKITDQDDFIKNYQVLQVLVIYVNNNLIKSLKITFQNFSIVISKNNIQFMQVYHYYQKLNGQLQYLKYFLDNLQILVNKLKICFYSYQFENNQNISLLGQIFCMNNLNKIFLQRQGYGYQPEISNTKFKHLLTHQYHKNILKQHLPQLIKLGLNRFEKIENFLSFFTIRSKNIEFNEKEIKYDDLKVRKYDNNIYRYNYMF